MRNRYRLLATTILVALVTALFIPFAGASANAASGHRVHHGHHARSGHHARHHGAHRAHRLARAPRAIPAFEAPTSHALAGVTCTREDHNTWSIVFTWRVEGGAYVNIGNGYDYKSSNDNVWRGGNRFVRTAMTISGWGDADRAAPETATAFYDHYVAPIGNRSAAIHLTDTQEVNLTCI